MTNQELIEIKVLFEEASKNLDEMSKKFDDASKNIDNASKTLDKSRKSVDDNINAFQSAGNALNNLGAGLNALGNNLLYFGASWSAGVSVPLERFGQDAFETFLALDQQWTRMSKSVGLSTIELKNIYGDFAQSLSEKFGQAQSDVVASLTAINLAGYNTEAQIRGVGVAAAIAAVNFDTDLANATKLVIQMMAQWGWTIDNVQAGLSMVNEVADATAT